MGNNNKQPFHVNGINSNHPDGREILLRFIKKMYMHADCWAYWNISPSRHQVSPRHKSATKCFSLSSHGTPSTREAEGTSQVSQKVWWRNTVLILRIKIMLSASVLSQWSQRQAVIRLGCSPLAQQLRRVKQPRLGIYLIKTKTMNVSWSKVFPMQYQEDVWGNEGIAPTQY
jgi:hypothetical protein